MGDIDERTSHALLEAWAAIVAAQERVHMAVSSGLLQRLSMSSTVQEQDAAGLSCGSMQVVAEKAHKIGVRAVNRPLWPFLEQALLRRLRHASWAPMAVQVRCSSTKCGY